MKKIILKVVILMLKILNKIFYILKILLTIICMLVTIYITMFMFQRLEKDIFGANISEFIQILIPFILLLIMYILNSFCKHDSVRNCLFYNITGFLVGLVMFVFCYRALFDQNMFMWHKYEYEMNFNYFSDQIAQMKIMLYGLSISNILLIIQGKLDNKNNNQNKKIKKMNN